MSCVQVRSEVASTLEPGNYEWPRRLVDRDPLAARCCPRKCRPHRQLQAPAIDILLTQAGDLDNYVRNPENEDRCVRVQVVGEQQTRRLGAKGNHRDFGSTVVDGEDRLAA